MVRSVRLGSSGLYVIADTEDGATSVARADQLQLDFDPQNGDDDAIALVVDDVIIDALAYGVNAAGAGEGTPALDPTPLGDGHTFSLARDENSTDTDDNATDFVVNPAPSPGAPNTPPFLGFVVDPSIVLASEDNDISVLVAGGGTFGGDEPVITIGDVEVECVYVEHDETVAQFLCALPARDGSTGGERQLPEGIFADVSVQLPQALGGETIFRDTQLLIEEGSANESDLELEADFCNIQFPTNDIQIALGDSTPLIFSQIFEAGLTDTSAGQATGVLVQFGLSRNATPTSLQDFVFSDGPIFNVEAGNNDEYSHSFVPSAEGTFRFLFRYSLDGGLNWTACDEDGAGSNDNLALSFDNAGTVVVGPPND